jgi:hypothetical protein
MATAGQVADRFELGRAVTYARLSGLVRLGLLEHARIFHTAPGPELALEVDHQRAELEVVVRPDRDGARDATRRSQESGGYVAARHIGRVRYFPTTERVRRLIHSEVGRLRAEALIEIDGRFVVDSGGSREAA